MKRTIFALTLLGGFMTTSLQGQTQYDVLVKSAFSPVIQDAQKKISFPAKIVDTVAPRPQMEYPLQVRPLPTHFTPEPIKAPRVGKDAITRLYQHYIKVGAGYLQPLLEYDFNTLRSTKQSFGLHLYSHASWNPVKECAPSAYGEHNIGLYGQQYREKFHFREEAGYAFDHYHCYGYPADSLEKQFGWSQKAEEIARHYQRAHASFEAFTPSTKNSLRLNRRYSAEYAMLFDNYHSFEHDVLAGLTLDKRVMVSRLDMFRLAGDLSMEYAHNYWDTTRGHSDTWLFRAAPKLQLEEDLWRLSLGVAVGVGLENGEASAAVFPDVQAHLDIVPEILSLYAGAEGGMYRDAFGKISLENPFLAPVLDLGIDRQYRLYLGTRTNLSNSLIFGARIGMEMHSGLPFYLPDTASLALTDSTRIRLLNTFGIAHAKASLTNVHLDAAYHYKEALRIAANLDYFSYSTDDTVVLFYKPQYVISLSAGYLWKNKIRVGMDWVWKGGLFAPEYAADGSRSKVSLPDWFDWSMSAEYLWNRRLRFFAELNNLLGRRNQRYAQYYTERFNCLLGVKYVFGGE
ncbi:MAG: TonB-dependent receptor [Bacteroidales bacterium]|nr:TonB-dependent receptor [Bacteroidales bacterium]